uniref:Apple domain-containing protein n=1 Tax=Mucochytrium quahogii TaxID=96639 RepID=A0A7S2SFH1_9STRA|mmetsp:Transcript_37081/g.60424  ORF Transcript_37081/g.60424 Transcript_37081/m.60424 type:complete len:867 (+) Transcript_37081:2422-5022(+)
MVLFSTKHYTVEKTKQKQNKVICKTRPARFENKMKLLLLLGLGGLWCVQASSFSGVTDSEVQKVVETGKRCSYFAAYETRAPSECLEHCMNISNCHYFTIQKIPDPNGNNCRVCKKYAWVRSTSLSDIWRMEDVLVAKAAQSMNKYKYGVRYNDRLNYTEYYPGNMNLIFTVPHDGDLRLTPDAIAHLPNIGRIGNGDRFTFDLAKRVADSMESQSGLRPHIIRTRLPKWKLNMNRNLKVATQGDEALQPAHPEVLEGWHSFYRYVYTAMARIKAEQGFENRGLIIDYHSQITHKQSAIELGYGYTGAMLSQEELSYSKGALMSGLIRKYGADSAATEKVIRGPTSLGAFLDMWGLKSCPSPVVKKPTGAFYYRGILSGALGSNHDTTRKFDSFMSEFATRIVNQRTTSASQIASGLLSFMKVHYGVKFTPNDPEHIRILKINQVAEVNYNCSNQQIRFVPQPVKTTECLQYCVETEGCNFFRIEMDNVERMGCYMYKTCNKRYDMWAESTLYELPKVLVLAPTTGRPTMSPTPYPTTKSPTPYPTKTSRPTKMPTPRPTTQEPTSRPTTIPTPRPTTQQPTSRPTMMPTSRPTITTTKQPTPKPTQRPTARPTVAAPDPTTKQPTPRPTNRPTTRPTQRPTARPTIATTTQPTPKPTHKPTGRPTIATTKQPTPRPTHRPTTRPTTKKPSTGPTLGPTRPPTFRGEDLSAVRMDNMKCTEANRVDAIRATTNPRECFAYCVRNPKCKWFFLSKTYCFLHEQCTLVPTEDAAYEAYEAVDALKELGTAHKTCAQTPFLSVNQSDHLKCARLCSQFSCEWFSILGNQCNIFFEFKCNLKAQHGAHLYQQERLINLRWTYPVRSSANR